MRWAPLLSMLAAVAAAPGWAAGPVITDLVPIPLQSGANTIPALSPDGRDGLVVLGWRDNGNAHSYDLVMVLLQAGKGGPWTVVRFEAPRGRAAAQGSDTLRDDPHTGDDVVRAFRFARGTVDGKPATLLLTATRQSAVPEPSPVEFQVLRLEHAPEIGTTPDHFTPILVDRPSDLFCNADLALSRRFGLPLRPGYSGAKTPNGCFE